MRILVFLMLALIASPAYSQITIGRYRVNGTIEINADLQIEEVVPMTTIPDPVAFWKADDLTSEYGSYDLTNVNSATFNTGKIGNAFYLDRSSSQYLKIANADAGGLQPAGDLSFQCWVKFDSAASFAIYSLVSKANSWSLLYQNVGSNFLILSVSNSTGSANPLAAFSHNTSSWFHVVGTYRASDGKSDLWINAAKVGSANAGTGGALLSNSNDFNIGSTNNSAGAAHDGQLDAVAVWHVLLSDAQIAALYNDGDGLELPIVTNATSFIPTYGTPALALATYGTSAAPIATMGVSKQ